jgi:hypothetical protein
MGITDQPATVMYRGNDHLLGLVLTRREIRDGHANHTWVWQIGAGRGKMLKWSDWKYYNPMVVRLRPFSLLVLTLVLNNVFAIVLERQSTEAPC